LAFFIVNASKKEIRFRAKVVLARHGLPCSP